MSTKFRVNGSILLYHLNVCPRKLPLLVEVDVSGIMYLSSI